MGPLEKPSSSEPETFEQKITALGVGELVTLHTQLSTALKEIAAFHNRMDRLGFSQAIIDQQLSPGKIQEAIDKVTKQIVSKDTAKDFPEFHK